MFSEIESKIIEVLQKHIISIPKNQIGTDYPKGSNKPPSISVNNISFEVSEVGMGRSLPSQDIQIHDMFSGNGDQIEFQLSDKPVRSQIRVEYPIRTRLPSNQYIIDYQLNRIIFHNPPESGEDNISVRYSKPVVSKGLVLTIQYNINIWAITKTERDKISEECIKAILLEESNLNQYEFSIKITRGYNNELEIEGQYCKTIELSVESNIQVESPQPVMEKIDVRENYQNNK